jgi:peptide/nickel transport system permease protein
MTEAPLPAIEPTTGVAEPAPGTAAPARGRTRLWAGRATAGSRPGARPSVVRRFVRHRGAVVGVLVLVVIVILAIVVPMITPYDPIKASAMDQLKPPTPAHPFGTDQFGRDVATRMAYGAPLSLMMGFVSVGIALTIGVALGLPSGYYMGTTDLVVMRFVDIMLAFPSILLALSIVSLLGPSLNNAMIAVGISVVPLYLRLVRGSTMTTRTLSYVEASRVTGTRDSVIMLRHILPNIIGPIVVVATLGIATAIIVGASLSYLGLGAQPPTPEWGAMLSDGRNFMQTGWWLSVFPGVAIILAVLSINLVGDGLRDVLDPRTGT